jgi:uracil-DNA glycosylase
MDVKIEPGWKNALADEFAKPYFGALTEFVRAEYRSQTIYPPAPKIFAAFDHCPYEDVKVVILGQDPYHGAGQANGLCFSVADGVRVPPSLQNIYKEMKADTGKTPPASGNLERWAQQGVLLLNNVLTVQESLAASHAGQGWETFTDAVVAKLNADKAGLVFILWGSPAQKKAQHVDANKHLVLKSVHPSPLSAARGFYGNHHFTKTNQYLQAHGLVAIDW